MILTSADDGRVLVYAADSGEIARAPHSPGAELTDGMILVPKKWIQQKVTLEGGNGDTVLPVTTMDTNRFLPLITTKTA